MWKWNPDDSQWSEHVGESAELAFREAFRRAMDLRDKETDELVRVGGYRSVRLVQVLDRLRELGHFNADDLWERP
jgi:hypothetical protein